MSDDTHMLESLNEESHRVAVFEDDGTSAWLYLSAPNDRKPVADVWVHNRIEAPPSSEIKSYRGGPPPAAAGYTEDSSICLDPTNHCWSFAWDPKGEAVALYCDGHPVAMLVASDRRGWSRNLRRDGPWGNVWSDSRYFSCIQNDG
ncbi:hypothetical protein [Bremerella sp.]|uniref:hypothetical protein n=1 Tax=Bremerella sp. TaxID=2795602 RepID=UPI00391A3EB9